MKARLPVGLTAAAIAGTATLLALGTWQVQRLHWKTALIAEIETRQKSAPVPLAEAMAAFDRGEEIDYLNVAADGAFTPGGTLFLLDSLDGKPGWSVISAFRDNGGQAVLVERGLIPEGARETFARADTAPLELTGQVSRHADARGTFTPDNDAARNIWFWRDIPAMLGAANLPGDVKVAPFILHAATDTGPKPRPLTANLRNNHLGYAITWYGLALALAAVSGLLIRRRMKSPEG